jgi:peptidoglycan hydrolase CwlO-like protein
MEVVMLFGLRVLVLSIGIASVITYSANAQQNPTMVNAKSRQIQQLNHDIQDLQQQLRPIQNQMQQLISQMNSLRDKMRPIEEKIVVDSRQIGDLLGKHL